ncbi:sensor histidine kinase [Flavobacterium sp. JP2137]|uniref:sensor histidine kinase n=1 Tax=Flavobacterium sp. JP2137 TaxID=3414510 RepID=UPI003D2FD368
MAFQKIGDAVFLTASGFFDTGGGLYELKSAKIVNKTSELGIKENDLKTVAYHKTNQFIYVGTKQNGIFQININPPVRHQKDLGTVYCLNTQDQKQFVFHNQGFSVFSKNEVIKHLSLAKFKKFQKENYQRFADKTTIKEHFYPIDYDTPSDKIKFYQSLLYKNKIWVSSNIGMFELSLSGEILSYHPVHVYSFTFFKDKLVTAVPYAGVRIFHNIYKMDYSYFHDWGNNKIPTEVVAITQTDEAIYFATALNGVYEFKDNKFRSWTLEGSFDEKKIKRIVAFNQYELIVVTDFNDVFILNTKFSEPKIVKQFSHQMIKGSSTNFVNSIQDVIYIGTNEGINVFYNKKWFFIDQEQGLTNTNSYSAVSSNEHLYLGTSEGFFELSNDYFVKKREDNTRVILSKIKVNSVVKEINTAQITSPKLNLPYNQNNVIIDFIAQHNKYPNKLHFKYRLKKSEPWIDIFDENRLILNYLKDDIYNIQILVTNLDTGIVQIQNLVELTVNPPFYTTWFFALGCLVFFSLAIIFIYKLRISYLKRRQVEELNMIKLQNEQEKTQLLFDKQLSDVKLQALQSQMNSHFLFNVLSSIQYYIICKDIDQALYYLERFAVLIRTTLDYSERKEICLSQEIEYLQHYIEIENLRAEYSIVFSIIVSPEINLDEIFITPMLLQPFVENAIVHGFTSTIIKPIITLEIQQLTDSIRLILSDNGTGYQVKKNKTHQSKGISIIQKRLDLSKKNLQNSLKIDTSTNGTVVTIEI